MKRSELTPFESSAFNVSNLAQKIVYSILTTVRIEEVVDETPEFTTMDNLMIGHPELYQILLYSETQQKQKNYSFN
jgi:hypothetical protein